MHQRLKKHEPKQCASEPAPGSASIAYWLLALALVLAIVSYAPTLRYGFVFDDVQQIVENPAIRSWNSLPQYFTAHVGAGTFPSVKGSFYRPLFLIWLRLNYIVFGLSPRGWHLTSLLAHLAVVCMFFALVRLWTRDGILGGWAALLFAVHPIHIEAVAWISAVPEVLFALAGMGSMYAYFRFRQQGQPVWLGISAAQFGLAGLAKETAVIIWPLMFIFQHWFDHDRPREEHSSCWVGTAKEQLPFAVITAIYFAMRFLALQGMRGDVTHSLRELSCAAPSITWFYLRKLLLPVELSQIYFDPDVWSFTAPHFYLPLIATGVVAAGLFLWISKTKSAVFPVLLMAVSLIPPILGVSVFPRHDLVHNRYLYLPSAGACMLVALALRRATELRYSSRSTKTWIATAIAVPLSMALLVSVWIQEKPYRDNITLFSRSLELAPQGAMAWGLLGEEYMTLARYNEGIAAFQRAQFLEPNVLLNNYRLGAAYYLVGDMPAAEACFQRSLETYHDPDVATYDYVLYRLGLSQYAQGKMPQAEGTLRRATALQPKGFGYHMALGATLKYQGNLREAKRQFELELQLGPDQQASALLQSVNAELSTGIPY